MSKKDDSVVFNCCLTINETGLSISKNNVNLDNIKSVNAAIWYRLISFFLHEVCLSPELMQKVLALQTDVDAELVEETNKFLSAAQAELHKESLTESASPKNTIIH